MSVIQIILEIECPISRSPLYWKYTMCRTLRSTFFLLATGRQNRQGWDSPRSTFTILSSNKFFIRKISHWRTCSVFKWSIFFYVGPPKENIFGRILKAPPANPRTYILSVIKVRPKRGQSRDCEQYVQVVTNCRYSFTQMCIREECLPAKRVRLPWWCHESKWAYNSSDQPRFQVFSIHISMVVKFKIWRISSKLFGNYIFVVATKNERNKPCAAIFDRL